MKRVVDSIFDKIATSAPVNKSAALEAARGVHFVSIKKITQRHEEVRPALRAPTAPELANPEFIDLTGRQYGRLTVLGIFADQGDRAKDAPQVWAVRCVCGRYESRKSKTIKKASPDDRCAECRNLESLRNSDCYAAPEKARKVLERVK